MPRGAGGKVQKPLVQVSVVQGLSSLHWAAVVHCLVTMQSEGSEFGCCEGYEQASRRFAIATPPKSSRAMEHLATVSAPPSKGFALLTAAAVHVESPAGSSTALVQRSGRSSAQLYLRTESKAAGSPFTVTQSAKLAFPSMSVSKRAQASPLLLPPKATSSQFQLTTKSKGAAVMESMQNSIRSFWPGSSIAPWRSGVHRMAADDVVGLPAAPRSIATAANHVPSAASEDDREMEDRRRWSCRKVVRPAMVNISTPFAPVARFAGRAARAASRRRTVRTRQRTSASWAVSRADVTSKGRATGISLLHGEARRESCKVCCPCNVLVRSAVRSSVRSAGAADVRPVPTWLVMGAEPQRRAQSRPGPRTPGDVTSARVFLPELVRLRDAGVGQVHGLRALALADEAPGLKDVEGLERGLPQPRLHPPPDAREHDREEHRQRQHRHHHLAHPGAALDD